VPQVSSRTHWFLFATFQLCSLAGCSVTAGTARPETADERAHSVQAAVYDVVRARCDLESHCRNIGPGQKFESRSVCESKMQGETASHVNTSDCPLGVEPRKLDACITSILAQDCGSLFDALNRWNACRNGQICYQ
jgi:hypothetical protein